MSWASSRGPVQLKYWTHAWLERIRDLYAAHDELMTAWNQTITSRNTPAAATRLEQARAAWDTAITAIDEARKKQMAAPGLQEPAKKALATLDREWDGLTAHREYPMISLDNNAAERMIRGPVVTRKNAGGSRNEDSARLASVIWTVTATIQMAGLNPLTYLTAYLDNCGRNSGKPPQAPAWKASCPGTPAPKTSKPGHNPHPPAKYHHTNNPYRRGHREPPHRPSACPSTGLPNTYWRTVMEHDFAIDEYQEVWPVAKKFLAASFATFVDNEILSVGERERNRTGVVQQVAAAGDL